MNVLRYTVSPAKYLHDGEMLTKKQLERLTTTKPHNGLRVCISNSVSYVSKLAEKVVLKAVEIAIKHYLNQHGS